MEVRARGHPSLLRASEPPARDHWQSWPNIVLVFGRRSAEATMANFARFIYTGPSTATLYTLHDEDKFDTNLQ